jgi:hypothetical protein
LGRLLNHCDAREEVLHEFMKGGRMAVYEIRVKGHLDGRWSEWFDGLTIANVENGDALLSGEIVDQSALHGVLNKVRDLGLPLMAVSRIKSMPEGLRPIKQDDEKGAGKR